MLREAQLLKLIVAAAQTANFVAGKNYTCDGNKLRVNRKTFKKNFCLCILLIGIQLLHLINTRFHSNNNDTGSLSLETTMGLGIASAVFLFLHYFYLVLIAGKEIETFFHAANTYEIVNFIDIHNYLQSASGKRFMILVRLMDLGGRRLSSSVGPQFMAISAVLLPSSPMNFLAFFPGKSCIDLMLSVIGIQTITKLSGYLLMALQFLCNWIIWVLIFKFGYLVFYHTGICALILSKYLLILKRKLGKPNGFGILSTINKAISNYQHIRILLIQFNRVHSNFLVFVLLTVITFMVLNGVRLIASLATVSFTDRKLIGMNCFYASVVLQNVGITIALFGGFGAVHDLAGSCLRNMRNAAIYPRHSCRGKILKRVVKSLPVLKVEFSATNFVEKITPFVYLEFSLLRIVDCLLLSKSKHQ
ncbi:unnamed protein product [Orchesella dallaii]|uniref:Odorant receptor n=1 Tax=Orchesella dallaii TaxID=48710 RepID=A0ABP1S8S7_9HEXA